MIVSLFAWVAWCTFAEVPAVAMPAKSPGVEAPADGAPPEPPADESPATETVPPPLTAAEQEFLDRGQAAYQRGEFAVASDELERGYALRRAPVFLYARAQAVRRLGRCAVAIELYDQYLATGPPPVNRADALDNRATCVPVVAAEREAERAKQAERDKREAERREREAWDKRATALKERRRRTTVGLLATGAVIGVAGAVLIGIGVSGAVRQKSTMMYEEFGRLEGTKRATLAAGVPMFTLGVVGVILSSLRMRR